MNEAWVRPAYEATIFALSLVDWSWIGSVAIWGGIAAAFVGALWVAVRDIWGGHDDD